MFVESSSCQAFDKNPRIDLKTCSSTSSRAQHSVVYAFQRVRLKVNGEATHSQDFLSVGRSVQFRRGVRTDTAHAQSNVPCTHARTRSRGIVRLRTRALRTRFCSNKFHAWLVRLRRGTSIFDPVCLFPFFFVIFVSKERLYLLVVLFLN